MKRRDFFKNAFALGTVAVVPHSIFKAVDIGWNAVIDEKEIDFGKYQAVLMWDDKVIATSIKVNLEMKRDIHRLESLGGCIEYVPGLMSFNIRMIDCLGGSDPVILRRALETLDELTLFMKDKEGNKYYADCYMVALISATGTLIDITYDIELQGSGALIIQ